MGKPPPLRLPPPPRRAGYGAGGVFGLLVKPRGNLGCPSAGRKGGDSRPAAGCEGRERGTSALAAGCAPPPAPLSDASPRESTQNERVEGTAEVRALDGAERNELLKLGVRGGCGVCPAR